jgi:hypothetical protein
MAYSIIHLLVHLRAQASVANGMCIYRTASSPLRVVNLGGLTLMNYHIAQYLVECLKLFEVKHQSLAHLNADFRFTEIASQLRSVGIYIRGSGQGQICVDYNDSLSHLARERQGTGRTYYTPETTSSLSLNLYATTSTQLVEIAKFL